MNAALGADMSGNRSTGLFLALEGVEGSGKSTQAGLLASFLREGGHEVVLAREPGSTPLGERVRALVLEERDLGIPARSELFLMLAARAAFLEQIVVPGLAAGCIVIADRFELSTLAYQGSGRGLPVEEILACNRFATNDVSPDLTLLLDLPPDEGARRQVAASKRPDRMESENREFHERVARGYDTFASSIERLARVDAEGSIEAVHARIISVLRERFSETLTAKRVIS